MVEKASMVGLYAYFLEVQLKALVGEVYCCGAVEGE